MVLVSPPFQSRSGHHDGDRIWSSVLVVGKRREANGLHPLVIDKGAVGEWLEASAFNAPLPARQFSSCKQPNSNFHTPNTTSHVFAFLQPPRAKNTPSPEIIRAQDGSSLDRCQRAAAIFFPFGLFSRAFRKQVACICAAFDSPLGRRLTGLDPQGHISTLMSYPQSQPSWANPPTLTRSEPPRESGVSPPDHQF